MVLRGLASALTWRRCLVSPPVPARPSPTPTCARQTCPDTALGSTVAGSCSAAREPGSGWPGRRLEPALALRPGWPRSCWAGRPRACGQARGWAASEGRPGEQVGLRRARQARQAWAGEASAGGRAVAPGRPALATGVHCLWPCVAQDPRPRPACPRFAADLCVAGPRRPGADAGRGRGCGLPRDPLSWGPGGSLRGPGLRTGGRQGRREPRPRLSRPGSLRGPVSCCPSKGLALEALCRACPATRGDPAWPGAGACLRRHHGRRGRRFLEQRNTAAQRRDRARVQEPRVWAGRALQPHRPALSRRHEPEPPSPWGLPGTLGQRDTRAASSCLPLTGSPAFAGPPQHHASPGSCRDSPPPRGPGAALGERTAFPEHQRPACG